MRITFTKIFLAVMISWLSMPAFSALPSEAQWTILETYPVNKYSCGLAFDGTYFYLGSYSSTYGTEVHRFDPETGESELFFHGPHLRAFGMTWDGEYLWLVDRIQPSSTMAFAMQIDLEGNLVSQFDLHAFYIAGIAWDEGDFWVTTNSPNPAQINKIDASGQVLFSFTSPENSPYDLAREGDFLWIAENDGGNIHKTDLQGNLIATHPAVNPRASGVYHDGTYLWYVSRNLNGDSFIYKVDPNGSGTPQMQVDSSVDFGNVVIGNEDNRNLNITNTGVGDLIIYDLYFENEDTPFIINTEFPVTIAPGSSFAVSVNFSAQEIDEYNETAILLSNDPFNTQKQISISGFGLHASSYLVSQQEVMDFGVVRINSSNRGYFELRNMGNIRLQIQDIVFPNDDFVVDELISLPVNINPTEEVSLPFWFRPSSAGDTGGEVEIHFNNASQSPFTMILKGISEVRDHLVGEEMWTYQMTGNPDNARAILSIPDVTGDGISDVVVGTRGDRLYCFAGNSSGEASVIWSLELGTIEYPRAIALLDDINNDGVKDFVAGTAWGDRTITAISSRTGEIIWQYQTNQYGGGGWVYMVDVTYDYNNNGYRDVLAATGTDGSGGGPRRVFLLNGLTGEVIWSTFLGEAAFSVLAVEDFTGDGIPDVVAGATTTNQRGRVVGINGANGNIEWQKQTTSGSSVWALGQLGDITGNGVKDVIAGSYNGNGSYYLMDATNGDIVFHGTLGNSLILDLWNAGDLNGDGFDDFIPAYTSVNNAVAISGQNGQILWSTPVVDQPWSVAPLSDITGDGINDIAIGTLHMNNRVYFLNGANGEVIESVSMRAAVDALTAIPDINGDNSMEVVAGTRDRYVTALSGGTDVKPQPFDITFVVTNDNDPAVAVENAVVVISETGRSARTDSAGYAVIDSGPGTYTYTVSKDGYYDTQGSFEVHDQDKTIQVVLTSDGTSIPEIDNPMVVAFSNFPNPFSEITNITFTLTRSSDVSVVVYDMSARSFFLVENQNFPAAENIIQWDGTDNNGNLLQNGIYFLEFRTQGNIYRNKVVLLRD